MIYNWDFSLVFARPDEWLRGAAVTLVYAAATIGFGLLIGLVCGIAMLSRHRVLMSPIHFYVQFFRSTPLLIQIVWFYYALPVIIGSTFPPGSRRDSGSPSTWAPSQPRSFAAGSCRSTGGNGRLRERSACCLGK